MKATREGKPRRSPPELPVGLRLRRLRRDNGITLDQVVAEAGLSDVTWLSRAERGFRPIGEEQAEAIRLAVERIVARRESQ